MSLKCRKLKLLYFVCYLNGLVKIHRITYAALFYSTVKILNLNKILASLKINFENFSRYVF